MLPGVPAGRQQLDARPSGKCRGADRVADLVRGAELIAGVTSAPLAAQPLTVQEAGAGQIHPQAGAAQAVDRLAVEVLVTGQYFADCKPKTSSKAAHDTAAAARLWQASAALTGLTAAA